MIILYLLILIVFGFGIESILEKINLIEGSKINKCEKISFSSLLGLLLFSWYILFLGMLNIKLSFLQFWPIIIIDILYIFSLFFHKKNSSINCEKKEIDYKFILLFISLIIIFAYCLTYAYFHNLLYPDEFAAWGLHAKRIFVEQKLNLFLNTGVEIYPDFLPILSSYFYFFSGEIAEHAIRIIPGVVFLFLIINLLGLLQKHNINKTYFLFFTIFIILTYTSFQDYTFSSYADMAFGTFYTLGILYLFEWLLYDNSNTNMFFSIIYMNGACWTKIDGLPMLVFNFAILILYFLIKKFSKMKLETNINWKRMIIYVLSISFIGIVWKGFSNTFESLPKSSVGTGASIVFNIQYLYPILLNMSRQQFSEWTWVILILICIISLLLNWKHYKDKKKIYIIFGILCVLFSMAFLLISYLTKFGAEATQAPSYIRYMTRALFIMLFITLFSLKNDQVGNIKFK